MPIIDELGVWILRIIVMSGLVFATFALLNVFVIVFVRAMGWKKGWGVGE
jgi:hypothetical protein